MELSGQKVLIIAGPQFEDRELFYPLYRFKEAGAEVKVAGIGEEEYTGKYGVPIEVDGQCEDFIGTKWDLVIVPGGWAPDKIRANDAALELVRATLKNKGCVASICHGPWVLASADVVKGVKLTSYKNIRHDLINAGANWVDEEVVVDSNIVTSRTPADLPAFCREAMRILKLAKV